MKQLFIIFFCFSSIFALTQDIKVVGFCKSYVKNDTNIDCKQIVYEEIYDSKGELKYQKKYPFKFTQDYTKIQYFGNPNIYITKRSESDSTISKKIIDTLNKKEYIIKNEVDTQFVSELIFENNLIIRSFCIKGCGEKTYYKYDIHKNLDTIITYFEDKSKSYFIYNYDSKNREILEKMWLRSPNDTAYLYVKTIYNDKRKIKVERSSNTGYEDDFLLTKTYCNKNWIPKKKIITFNSDDLKYIYTIKYKKVSKF
jgi:hypothetical protein